MSGFEKACNSIHNEMIVRSTGNSPSRQADAILALLDKKVGGIAMVPATAVPTPPYQIRQLQQQGVPVVFCHRGVEGVSAPTIAIDFEEIGRMAIEQFVKRGRERIAYLALSARGDQATFRYKRGLQEALRQKNLELREEFVYKSPNEEIKLPVFNYEKSIRQWLEDVFKRADAPTAIFVPFDPLAEMVMSLLDEMGVRIPQDVALLSFGPKWREMLIARRLSAIVIDSIQIGQQACDLLAEMRSGQRRMDDGQQFEVQPTLSEGKTLGPAL